MNDSQLFQLILPIISTGLIADGFTGVTVLQAYQPTQQGIQIGPSVFVAKLSNYNYGFPEESETWDGTNMVLVENQQAETTFRVQALAIQNPATPNAYTASDLANEVASIMRSRATITILAAARVGILRIMDVSNENSKDDRAQFEAFPAFNFTLQHGYTRISDIPVIESIESTFARI